eukprot:3659295-Prymnesium_polylepis.1
MFSEGADADDGDFRADSARVHVGIARVPGHSGQLTVGEGREGVERRTDVAPKGRLRPVGGVVRAAGGRGGRASQTATFSPGRALDFTDTEGGSI